MKEVWKDISGYEGIYQVSNIGNVRSMDRVIFYKNGRVINRRGGVMSFKKHPRGYHVIGLCKDGGVKYKTVHRLVIETFVGKSNLDVDHINGIKTDNHVENLQWMSKSDNSKKSLKGSGNGRAKVNESDVAHILINRIGWRDVVKKYGLSEASSRKIISGSSWSHVHKMIEIYKQ